jgi:hypothetical protein
MKPAITDLSNEEAFWHLFSTQRSAEPPIDFKENASSWIKECRAAGFIPCFRTRYAGERYPENKVLGVCWLSGGKVSSQWFKGVPEEDLEAIESGRGDWRWILKKYRNDDPSIWPFVGSAIAAIILLMLMRRKG